MGGGDDREEEEGSNTGEGACGVGYETGPMSEPPDTATQARPASAVVEDVPDSPVPVEEERREEREEEEEDAFAAPIVKRPPLSRRGSVSPSVGKRSRAGDASSVDRRVADAVSTHSQPPLDSYYIPAIVLYHGK